MDDREAGEPSERAQREPPLNWECYGCGMHLTHLDRGFNTQCPYCGSYEIHLSDEGRKRWS